MFYTTEQAVKNNCDKTFVTALTDGVATQCQHDLNHTCRLAMKTELNQDLNQEQKEFVPHSRQQVVDPKTPIARHTTATKTMISTISTTKTRTFFRLRLGSRNKRKKAGSRNKRKKAGSMNK
ncbi:Hypothetical predicted protein [Paramuricea clavata]|uniref:Uncharacterized protein n=1 Tax=Paramuricea clavata TaxID=317549 RepID=A0A7D9I9A3_PARCT|nr:Hypothetical predicted protein [Paramuricea clavata]